MDELVFKLADEEIPRDRLALLLDRFSRLSDERESWRVMYPLAEVLLLLTCATICSCDDFDEIAAWGESHLAFLRRFLRISLRHSQRALAARSRQPHRSAHVRAVFRELDCGALAGSPRLHRHRRQDLAAHRRQTQGADDLAPEKRLPRLIDYNRFWRVQHVGNGSGAIHA